MEEEARVPGPRGGLVGGSEQVERAPAAVRHAVSLLSAEAR